jgi:predicted nucleotidyltransferase
MATVATLIDHCASWAKEVRNNIGVEAVYIFGSTLNRVGEHFDSDRSDVDLLLVLPRNLSDALKRTNWLISFQGLKFNLGCLLYQFLGVRMHPNQL